MDWGMANRMAQLFKNGRCMFMPIDHGYFQGPTRKLECPAETVAPLMEFAEALFVTRGVLRSCIDPVTTKPVVLRVSGGPSVIGPDLADEGITTAIEDVIRMNAFGHGYFHICRYRI